jgi:hypothetical protein
LIRQTFKTNKFLKPKFTDMKLLIILFTAASSLFINTSNAADKIIVAPAAVRSFHSTFAQACGVTWSLSNDLYKADFNLNGQYASAFYDVSGTLVATSRNISSTQLPIMLQASLKKDYAEYWISDLFEMTNQDGTRYYITLENGDTKLILNSATHTGWETFQRTRKP